MADNRAVIGFDMGGTKMLASVFDRKFQQIASAKTRTPPGAGNDEIFAVIVTIIQEALTKAKRKSSEIIAVGIAVPGPIDRDNGRIIALTNVGVKDFALRDKLQSEIGIPVFLENDVNAGTFGEYVAGAAAGSTNVVGVFPGTGVGGGLIIGGKLYRGRGGQAGEIGHLTVMVGGPMCGCGKYGCLEAVASKTAIAKDLVHLASMGAAPRSSKRLEPTYPGSRAALSPSPLRRGSPRLRRSLTGRPGSWA
ncbi:MAG: ROK family protein [Spirochaetales bacterium]|nr:MAG: ROK family protein [Spirochaetales bacterium]